MLQALRRKFFGLAGGAIILALTATCEPGFLAIDRYDDDDAYVDIIIEEDDCFFFDCYYHDEVIIFD